MNAIYLLFFSETPIIHTVKSQYCNYNRNLRVDPQIWIMLKFFTFNTKKNHRPRTFFREPLYGPQVLLIILGFYSQVPVVMLKYIFPLPPSIWSFKRVFQIILCTHPLLISNRREFLEYFPFNVRLSRKWMKSISVKVAIQENLALNDRISRVRIL